jgi:hypothetical protein
VAFGVGSALLVIGCAGMALGQPANEFARRALHFGDGVTCGLGLAFLMLGSLGVPSQMDRCRKLPPE